MTKVYIDILLFTIVTICLVTDLKSRRIYNKVLLPGLVLGVGLSLYSNGLMGLIYSGQGFLLGLGLLLLPFVLGGIGGGDVKLLATIGTIKGPQFVFATFVGMGIAGGIMAMGILIYQRRLTSTLKHLGQGIFLMGISGLKDLGTRDKENYFPYGVAIALGVLVAYGIG